MGCMKIRAIGRRRMVAPTPSAEDGEQVPKEDVGTAAGTITPKTAQSGVTEGPEEREPQQDRKEKGAKEHRRVEKEVHVEEVQRGDAGIARAHTTAVNAPTPKKEPEKGVKGRGPMD